MNKFKAGDKVSRVEGDVFRRTGKKIHTVHYVAGDRVYTLESVDWIYACNLELDDVNKKKRKALEAAIKLCQSYKIGFSSDGPQRWFLRGKWCASQKEALDELFPTETPQQKEIERIENEMRKLSNDLAALKN